VDGPSSIEVAPAAAHQQEGQVIPPGHSRMDLEALAAPCTPHALSPAEPPVPAVGLDLALRAPASAPGPDLALRAPEPVAQVA
jgi:hypothetical protein